jgi:S-adenosylmethionine decarboxylase
MRGYELSRMLQLIEPTIENKEELVYEATGVHLLLTLKGCSSELLNDPEKLGALAKLAAEASRATVLQICVQQFSPQGVTVAAVLAESHASLHTYPEWGTIFWDCFTCGTTCDPELGVPVLVNALKATSISKQLVQRS